MFYRCDKCGHKYGSTECILKKKKTNMMRRVDSIQTTNSGFCKALFLGDCGNGFGVVEGMKTLASRVHISLAYFTLSIIIALGLLFERVPSSKTSPIFVNARPYRKIEIATPIPIGLPTNSFN